MNAIAHKTAASTHGAAVADTAPPAEAPLSPLRAFKAEMSRKIADSILPLATRCARGFVSGESVDDALAVALRLAEQQTATTLGFWDTPDYTRQDVADIYLAAVARLSANRLDSYVSIKPPALGFDVEVAQRLAAEAGASGIRLHFDSHGPEVADASNRMLETMLPELSAGKLGTTIPGRWLRSLDDAVWASKQQLNVRVVKGQWPDPAAPNRDLQQGFVEVIETLAGRARFVAVATHDMGLAAQAIAILRAAGTPCELEQIYGMNSRRALRWARREGVTLRLYVPFGRGYVANALGILKRNPRLALVVMKSLLP
jgi:proline dehydrogenase